MEEILNQLNEIRKLYDDDSEPPRTRHYEIGDIRVTASNMLPRGTAMLSDDVMCLFLDLMDEISGETPPDDTMF